MSVYKKLMEARTKLQSMKLKKSGKNGFAGYEYFELADFLPQVQTIFGQVGLCGVVSYEHEIAKLTITNIEDPKDQIVITSPMSEANLKGCHPVQNLGAVETYQRRYLWVTAMEILEHDALDSTVTEEKPEKPVLTPENKMKWSSAKVAFMRDGDLVSVLKRVTMTNEHQEQLIAECANEVA